MKTEMTTQSIQEKIKLRVLPGVFVVAGVAFLAGAVYMFVTSPAPKTTSSTTSTASLSLNQPECDPLLARNSLTIPTAPTDPTNPAVIVAPNEPADGPVPVGQAESRLGCPPSYKPGELIVKFKTDRAVSDVKAALKPSLFGFTSNQLKTVSQQYKLEKLDKVFTSVTSPAQLKQKFPQRAARAPKNVPTPNLSRIYKLSFPANTDIMALAKQFGKIADVEYAEPNYKVSLDLAKIDPLVIPDNPPPSSGTLPKIPNDPYFSSSGSWGQVSSSTGKPFLDMWGLESIKAVDAWGVTTGNSNVIVAVSDTGIDYNHPDLQGQIWMNTGEIKSNGIDDDGNGFIDDIRGWDFGNNDNDPIDTHGHGTHVAGTIGAKTNNDLGVAGINWGVKLMAVKAPGFGDRRKEMLKDIAIVTNGQVISDDLGLKMENTTLEMLGSARKVIATKENTTIVDGKGDKKLIEARIAEIRTELDNTDSDFDKEKLQERLAKLAGGVAVLKVGAATETEMKEKKLRIEDAIQATKAAVEEGIVAGGGVALLRAMKGLDALKLTNEDEKVAVKILRAALESPVRQIAENAGQESSVILAETLKSKGSHGYNAATNVFEDLVAAGIVDPTKVTRTALQNAASISALMLTTEVLVTDKPEEKKDMPAGGGMPGGMGGMGMGGGMDY